MDLSEASPAFAVAPGSSAAVSVAARQGTSEHVTQPLQTNSSPLAE